MFKNLEWKKYTRSQIISMNAVLCAMVLLFVAIPIQIGPLSLAVIPVIAIIISAEVLGWLNGMITGLFFGLVSLVGHFIRPIVLSFAFYNPLVSVFPRILIGLFAYLTVKGLTKLFPKMPLLLANAFGAAIGVLTNTVGVLGFTLLFYYGRELGSGGSAIGWEWLAGVLLTNSILEIVVCTVVTPPVVLAVNKTLALTAVRKKSRPEQAVPSFPAEKESSDNDGEI